MPKKKLTKNTNEGTEKKKRNIRRNKARGSEYERSIVLKLREIGYESVATSRLLSRDMDNKKIDIVDPDNKLPCYIQAKAMQVTPDYFGIANSCPLKDKPFVIFWKKTKSTESTIRAIGEVCMIPTDFFYKLLKNYQNE